MIDIAPPLRHARRASALRAVAVEQAPTAAMRIAPPTPTPTPTQSASASASASPSSSASAPSLLSASSSPTITTLADFARDLAADPGIEPQSEAFRHLLITRLRSAWPDAGARQITAAAIEIRLLLIGRTARSADASSTDA